MNAIETLKETYKFSSMVLQAYVGDFTDEELMQCPGPGCNSAAWQLGHLISSGCGLLQMVAPENAPKLPEGFEAKHAKENAGSSNPADFLSTQEYMKLFADVQEATFRVLDQLSESDLDKPSPERMRGRFPTVGSVCILISTHAMMHAGQFVPIRRALNKPVVI